jgi:hypothetical protein
MQDTIEVMLVFMLMMFGPPTPERPFNIQSLRTFGSEAECKQAATVRSAESGQFKFSCIPVEKRIVAT